MGDTVIDGGSVGESTRNRESGPSSLNTFPISSMAAGWLGPLLMFWLYVWGPLRPFDYPPGDLTPDLVVVVLGALLSIAMWWMPGAYFRVRRFEKDGRLYERLGVRQFRWLVPDGDLANRLYRRRNPGYRLIRSPSDAKAFLRRTELSEKGHLVLLIFGLGSAGYAWSIGWFGWVWYLSLGNVIVNAYPILLQRYTRSRIRSMLERPRFRRSCSN